MQVSGTNCENNVNIIGTRHRQNSAMSKSFKIVSLKASPLTRPYTASWFPLTIRAAHNQFTCNDPQM